MCSQGEEGELQCSAVQCDEGQGVQCSVMRDRECSAVQCDEGQGVQCSAAQCDEGQGVQ